jgi:hypothetical protein
LTYISQCDITLKYEYLYGNTINKKIKLSQEELFSHFDEQLQFLIRSCDAYDEGFENEAKRIAVTIRILLHDTANSKSLLGLLGKLDTQFHDTSDEFVEESALSYHGLTSISLNFAETKYIPRLDGYLDTKLITFEEWWNKIIFGDSSGRTITRKELILTAANQDGGAHVDADLNTSYADLKKNNSLGWMASDGKNQTPLANPERAAIRQIAHEVLKSLITNYTKKLEPKPGLIFFSSVLITGDNIKTPDDFINEPVPIILDRKYGRNEKCPCNSGMKFKHCHG